MLRFLPILLILAYRSVPKAEASVLARAQAAGEGVGVAI